MARTISVCAWNDFQHYKKRDPTWIKLYRDVLTNEAWVLGTDQSRLVQIAITLLAARYKNAIPLHHGLFRKVACLDMGDQELDDAIFHLQAHKFLEIKGSDESASTTLAKRYVREEKSREEKSREDTTARKRARLSEEDPEGFAEFRQAFPPRAGSQPWSRALKCWRARRAEGASSAELIAGAKRYATFIEATGRARTETVLQAATFLGPEKHFQNLYPPPAQKETAWDEIQRLNGGNHASAGRVFESEQSSAGLVPLLRSVRG